jgi:hypothetical protein
VSSWEPVVDELIKAEISLSVVDIGIPRDVEK